MSRVGKRWTPEEDEILDEMYSAGSDVNEIAIVLRRYPKGIAYRLMNNNVISDYTEANGWLGDDYRPEYIVALRNMEYEAKLFKKPIKLPKPPKPAPNPKPIKDLTAHEQRKILRRKYLRQQKKLI